MECKNCGCTELVTKHKAERGTYVIGITDDKEYYQCHKNIPIYCISCDSIVNGDELKNDNFE